MLESSAKDRPRVALRGRRCSSPGPAARLSLGNPRLVANAPDVGRGVSAPAPTWREVACCLGSAACACLPRPPGLRRLGTDWARSFVMVRSAELSLQGVPATRRSNESATSRSTTRFVPELPPRAWSHRPRAGPLRASRAYLTTAAAGAMLTRVSDERLMCWLLAETSLRPPIVGLRHLSSLNVPALGPRPKEKRAPLRSRKGVV